MAMTNEEILDVLDCEQCMNFMWLDLNETFAFHWINSDGSVIETKDVIQATSLGKNLCQRSLGLIIKKRLKNIFASQELSRKFFEDLAFGANIDEAMKNDST